MSGDGKKKTGLTERAIGAAVLVLGLYALAAVLWFVSQEAAWKKAEKRYAAQHKKMLAEKKLISETAKWNVKYENEKAKLPLFPEGEKTDTYWLRKMDEAAMASAVSITHSQAQKEEQVGEIGEVFELPIDVSNWESSLYGLVRFMYGLERAENALFDVKSIAMKPSSARKGYLKGKLTLTCAYMKEE